MTQPLNPDFAAALAAIPKAELHVHLQGSTQPETLLTLAKRNHIELPVSTLDGVRAWYQYRDFDHFLTIYDVICTCFQSGEDLEFAARAFAEEQAAQNILYTELTYTPNRHLPFAEQFEALHAAQTWAKQTHDICINYVIDIAREFSPDDGVMLAEWAIKGRDYGVVGFGLGGGPENAESTHKFADAFALAREAGVPCVPHAGEHSGAESVWAALTVCDAVRIGHGVRCLEDAQLVATLCERGTVLEVCPMSNVLLGVCPTYAAHPLPHLIDAGLRVTLNSDDPPMFNTTLTQEYQHCAATFGFTPEQMRGFVLTAIDAALMPDSARIAWGQRYQAAFDALSFG